MDINPPAGQGWRILETDINPPAEQGWRILEMDINPPAGQGWRILEMDINPPAGQGWRILVSQARQTEVKWPGTWVGTWNVTRDQLQPLSIKRLQVCYCVVSSFQFGKMFWSCNWVGPSAMCSWPLEAFPDQIPNSPRVWGRDSVEGPVGEKTFVWAPNTVRSNSTFCVLWNPLILARLLSQ